MDLQELNNRFYYTSDPKNKDKWFIIKEADVMRGDCEDYALSVLYYDVCKENILKFWLFLLLGKSKICFVKTHNNIGHAVLKHDSFYIDNWTKKWVTKSYMEKEVGHKFNKLGLFWGWQVAIKMLKGKL